MASLSCRVKGLPLLLAFAALLVAVPGASAASISVTTTADEFNANGAACSLREAIWAANNDSASQAPGCAPGSGNDTIDVPAGTYELTRPGANENLDATGDLDVTGLATIRHVGPGTSVVDAKGIDRVLQTNAVGVAISDLVIRGGSTAATATSGGGILNSGALEVSGSTITGNLSGLHGGGIESGGAGSALILVNSTVSGNQAAVDGGGVDETSGQASLLNATISGNVADSDNNTTGQAGGVGNFGGATAMRSTLVAGNVDRGGQSPDCLSSPGATLVSQGATLLGNPTGCTLTPGAGDVVAADPKLAQLADNGGPTPTEALASGSSAIDRGTGCAATDQRGVPRSVGGACDIGAYELVRCKGRAATRIGTNGADALTGTAGPDVFVLLGGNDRAFGLGGNDRFCGGAGDDREVGGAGRDSLHGDTGKDNLLGGPGNDLLAGGGGSDRLKGGGGRDRLRGGGSRDLCNGGGGRRDRASGCERRKKVP
jgi:CSLREA domain-containing protein